MELLGDESQMNIIIEESTPDGGSFQQLPSTVAFCSEMNCSTLSVEFSGTIHYADLSCSNEIRFLNVPSGDHLWSVAGCGMFDFSVVYVPPNTDLTIRLCPGTSGLTCCPVGNGCGSGGAFVCSDCKITTTTTSRKTGANPGNG